MEARTIQIKRSEDVPRTEKIVGESSETVEKEIQPELAESEKEEKEQEINQLIQILQKCRPSFLQSLIHHLEQKKKSLWQMETIAEPVGETPKEPQAENTTGIPSLDGMIDNAPYSTATAVYAGIELGRNNPELGKKIQAFVQGLMPEFFENTHAQKTGSKGGENLDIECDVLPAIQWLRFIDGFKAAMPSETTNDRAKSETVKPVQESGGDPVLQTIKNWLGRRTYSDKLTAILSWQLINKEGEFDKSDEYIGNNYYRQWEQEIIKKSGDPEYLNNAEADEVAVTATTAMMLYWEV